MQTRSLGKSPVQTLPVADTQDKPTTHTVSTTTSPLVEPGSDNYIKPGSTREGVTTNAVGSTDTARTSTLSSVRNLAQNPTVKDLMGGMISAHWTDESNSLWSVKGGWRLDSVEAKRVGPKGHRLGIKLQNSTPRETTVKDLGSYEGSNPALQGKRIIQADRVVSRTLGGELGSPCRMLGLGVDLSGSREHRVQYLTHVEPAHAQQLLEQMDKPQGLFGLGGSTLEDRLDVELPDLSRPETLLAGDELRLTTSGTIHGGFVVSVLGTSASVQASVQGDFDIGARRLDDTHIELMFTPTRIRNLGLDAKAFKLGSAELNQVRSRSLRQAFVFDLSSPEAHQAYEQALLGKLPCGLPRPDQSKTAHQALAAVMHGEQLPPGVQRTALESVELGKRTKGMGLTISTLETLLPALDLSDLAVSHTDQHLSHVATNGSVVMLTDTWEIESSHSTPLHGLEAHGISVCLHRIGSADGQTDPPAMADVMLTARFRDGEVHGLESNTDVIAPLNAAFGTSLSSFKVKGHGQEREVMAAVHLTPQDCQHLSTLERTSVDEAARRAHISSQSLADLCSHLARANTPMDQAECIRGFLHASGMAGLGAIYQACGAKADSLNVKATGEVYTAPVSQAETLSLRYAQPVAADASAREVIRRFERVEKTLEEIKHALVDVDDDPILDPVTRAQYRLDLEEARTSLEPLLSVDHLTPRQRRDLWERVNVGPIFGTRQHIMDRLDQAGMTPLSAIDRG